MDKPPLKNSIKWNHCYGNEIHRIVLILMQMKIYSCDDRVGLLNKLDIFAIGIIGLKLLRSKAGDINYSEPYIVKNIINFQINIQ